MALRDIIMNENIIIKRYYMYLFLVGKLNFCCNLIYSYVVKPTSWWQIFILNIFCYTDTSNMEYISLFNWW